jgi:hypothetical protein
MCLKWRGKRGEGEREGEREGGREEEDKGWREERERGSVRK